MRSLVTVSGPNPGPGSTHRPQKCSGAFVTLQSDNADSHNNGNRLSRPLGAPTLSHPPLGASRRRLSKEVPVCKESYKSVIWNEVGVGGKRMMWGKTLDFLQLDTKLNIIIMTTRWILYLSSSK